MCPLPWARLCIYLPAFLGCPWRFLGIFRELCRDISYERRSCTLQSENARTHTPLTTGTKIHAPNDILIQEYTLHRSSILAGHFDHFTPRGGPDLARRPPLEYPWRRRSFCILGPSFHESFHWHIQYYVGPKCSEKMITCISTVHQIVLQIGIRGNSAYSYCAVRAENLIV